MSAGTPDRAPDARPDEPGSAPAMDDGLLPVSVLIITKNEERHIGACLDSVSWARERIVVDAESTDRTTEHAGSRTTLVFVRPWEGFSSARTFAMTQATQPWMLWLDADERVDAELAANIRTLITSGGGRHAAWRMARRAYFLGAWIRHCGWYPGYVTRLFRAGRARFNDNRVHESLIVDGSVGTVAGHLDHYTDDSLEEYLAKFDRYTTLAAEDLAARGRRVRIIDLVLRPAFQFFKMYILRAGVLDGVRGFLLCRLSASYVFTKYAKLWERQHGIVRGPGTPGDSA